VDRPDRSLRELAGTCYVDPRRNPDLAWAFASRFLFVLAYAFLTTYQACFLLDELGSAEAEVPHQIFLGTVVRSSVVVLASLVGGRLSDRTGRRKVFVLTGAIVHGLAMSLVAIASDSTGFLVGMALSGLGFGIHVAVDSRWSPTCCRTGTTPGTSASSTSPTRCLSPSRPPPRRPSCR
jgi:MFS family permease